METKIPRVLLGISGSSALVSLLPEFVMMRRLIDEYVVVMTPAACRLISPTLVSAVLDSPVYTDQSSSPRSLPLHKELVTQCDIALIAPASLNTLSSLAAASTDNLLTLTLSNFLGPIGLVPSLNTNMKTQTATQRVLRLLEGDGFHFAAEEEGAAADLVGAPQTGVSKYGLRRLLVQLARSFAEESS